ncbi:MAG: carbohydrate kinase family protein [Pleomorphochaeta sp.]|jgi:sugar/nucleoside kinase (ribokinase family)
MSFVASTGIINVDILYGDVKNVPKEGTEIFSKAFDIQLGGGAAATMINLSRLNVPAKLITLLGEDTLSLLVKEQLNNYKQPYINIYEGSEMPLTVTSVVVTKKDRTFISYRKDIPITDGMKDKVFDNCKGAKIIQMQEGYEDVYIKLKKIYPQTIFVYDTGWVDHLSIEKFEKYLEIADYFTPSIPEALKITNTKNIIDAAKILHKYFKKVIIKLDNKGCFVSTDTEQYVVPALDWIKKVDSTGAGDAFLSGFIYGLFYNKNIADCVIYGNISGGYCVKDLGCLTSYPSEVEFETNYKMIKDLIDFDIEKYL